MVVAIVFGKIIDLTVLAQFANLLLRKHIEKEET